MWWIGDNYAGNFGPQRNLRMKPFQTYVRKGYSVGRQLRLPGDTFAAALWRVGVGSAADLERHLRREAVWHRGVRRRAHRAAFIYGVGGGTMFLEDRVGTIEVGKEADLAVWDRNPYRFRPISSRTCAVR